MADYFLTRRAILDLEDIYDHSLEKWGEKVADHYIEALYEVFDQITKNSELGKRKQKRSHPFLMVSAKKHFVIYDVFPKGVIILTLLHQVRDIENIIRKLDSSFIKEINDLKKQFPK